MTEKLTAAQTALPWYRQAWPWFLISLPATAVVAGIITLVLAVRSFDGLVADDYYKEGLGINKRIAAEQLAASMGLRGELRISQGRATLTLQAREGVTLVDELRLALINPARAGADREWVLRRGGSGYTSEIPALDAGRWSVVLADPQTGWRLHGEIRLPTEDVVVLEAGAS